jgi:predicted enzyme related to lactoylglutathione lyase
MRDPGGNQRRGRLDDSPEEARMWSDGSFYWNELMTRDAEAAKRFYGATLGWTFEAMEAGAGSAYWVAKAGGEPVAGILQMEGPDFEDVSESWFGYVAVKDLATALARAMSEGGQVIREPFDVPGVGRIAIVADNAGVAMGWMTPAD